MDKGKGKRGGEPKRLYQRDGIYYARVTVQNVEYRRSLRTGNRKEAERRLKEWLKGVSPYKGTTRHSFKEAAALWYTAGEWKPKTDAGYVKLLNELKRHFGNFYWDEITKEALQAFVEKMRQPEPPRRMKGAGTATINRYLSVISGIATHVKELPGWPEDNPVERLPKKPRVEKRLPYIRPPESDIQAFFARMHGTFGDLCLFALKTGARMDEVATLKADDATGGRAQLWETKHKFRVITLSSEARAIVERQPKNKSGYLFETSNGDRYKRVSEMWREIVNRAQNLAQLEGRKLTRMRFHDLRHEYAIRELESGRNIYLLKDHLGHSTVRQTEEYLRYLTPEQAAQVRTGSAH